MLDCERKDKNKRIAFVNDEPRIKGLMEYTGLSYKDAVSYTMMGCNELALPGGMVFGFDPVNILRYVESTFHKRYADTVNCKQIFRKHKKMEHRRQLPFKKVGFRKSHRLQRA